MKLIHWISLTLISCIFACTERIEEAKPNKKVSLQLTQYVNPLIGTAKATTARVLGHNTETFAQTIPAVGMPNGMTQWTPQTRETETKCVAPYYYSDSLINGFRGTHWLNGSCVQDYGTFTIMPLNSAEKLLPNERATTINHENEKSTPSLYSLTLVDLGIEVQMTSTNRSGFFKFSFPNEATPTIVFEPNSDEIQGYVKIIPEKNQIVGYNPAHRIYQGWGKEAGFSGYFVAEFNQPFEKLGIFSKEGKQEGVSEGKDSENLGAYVQFAKGTTEAMVRIGTSFTSLANAEKNLQAEINHWDFERTVADLESAWDKQLNKVQVKGAEKDKTIFYTALYHAFQHPRLMSDVDGSYPGFADNADVQKAEGFNYYGDFSAWDTYRAVHPLNNLLSPEKSKDFIRSLAMKAEQGGWMPIFPCWNNYTAAMIGDHVASLMGDAYAKGISIPEIDNAYAYLKKNAFEMPKDLAVYKDGKGRRALDSYIKYGYIPMEDGVPDAFHKNEQVSRTLEYAYDDFSLARLAEMLDKTDDAKILDQRALNYQNIYDARVGYMRGKYADGKWFEAFEPNENMLYITEGTPKHYSWYVPHDIQGLINLSGGEAQFNAKLDTFFQQGEYWHGNEPCHQTYFMYNYSGQPWKSQQIVRQIIREDYHEGVGGLSGNEDSGQMSAWLVFAAMGFYPVSPSVPEYALVSPMFEEVKLNLNNGKSFVIQADGANDDNLYIHQATLNGESFGKAYLTHEQITNNGTLTLTLENKPNKDWAITKEARPFSLSKPNQ